MLPGTGPDKVIVTGQGVQPRGVLASLPTSFLVDTRDAGVSDLDVIIQVRQQQRAPQQIRSCVTSGVRSFRDLYVDLEAHCGLT